MTEKRFVGLFQGNMLVSVKDRQTNNRVNIIQIISIANELNDEKTELKKENEQLKAQLYCDNEEGICNICKHHYLVKNDETEFGYYNSRCRKEHYECAKNSLKHCKDFKEVEK